MWQTMDTFPFPKSEWDFPPSYLFYSKEFGVVMGMITPVEGNPKIFKFKYAANEWELTITHWMPLPDAPQ